jgi:protein TonB
MLFLAASLHLFIILGVSFEFEDRKKPQHRQQSMEIMVVQHPKEAVEDPENKDYLAQVSQTGGGELETKAKPSTPAITPPLQPVVTPPRELPTQETIAETSSTSREPALTQTKSTRKLPVEDVKPVTEPDHKPNTAQLFASKQQEIVYLTAELQRKTSAYAKLPRRKAISASTQEYKYAAYLDAWRRKVERIGNLNYPDEAKRQKLYGNLILHVAVRKDGSVEQVRVLHSSGHKLLDDAAIRIVRLAAPFSPFPQEIRAETDILDITRTWQFLRTNQLGSR